MQPPQVVAGKGSGASPGANADPKQRLVGINISHAAQKLLIQKCALDGGFPSAKERGKVLKANLKRLRARSFELFIYAQPSKAARINKSQFPPRRKPENCMGVFRELAIGRADQQAAGHPEVHNPLRPARAVIAGLKIEHDVFPQPPYVQNSL